MPCPAPLLHNVNTPVFVSGLTKDSPICGAFGRQLVSHANGCALIDPKCPHMHSYCDQWSAEKRAPVAFPASWSGKETLQNMPRCQVSKAQIHCSWRFSSSRCFRFLHTVTPLMVMQMIEGQERSDGCTLITYTVISRRRRKFHSSCLGQSSCCSGGSDDLSPRRHTDSQPAYHFTGPLQTIPKISSYAT